ncbi:glycosyltransferase family 2 protein [Microbacterium horticulturae]|uniref:glycosyltransferase family 2 protein n=1 Tax=Microbacterium horticulturae TaxID=3028316 RepID=UPI003D172C30
MPFLNEEAALQRLLPKTPADIALVLVDNGSSDASGSLALSSGAVVIENRNARRVGECIELGIEQSLTDVVCVMDCDATVSLPDALRLIRPVLNRDVDFTVGTRASHSVGWTPAHRASSGVRDWLVRRALHNWPFTDLGSARAFRRSVVASSRPFNARYGWNLDFTIHAVESLPSDRVASIEIPYHLRLGPSHISGNPCGALTAMVDQLRVVRSARSRAERNSHEARRISMFTPGGRPCDAGGSSRCLG